MNRIVIVLLFSTAAASASALEVEKTFNKTCGICHISGVAMAPKAGDAKDWAPRVAKGIDALVQSVTTGMGAMPPKGMCADCSADDIQGLIEYMLPK